jgi:hypothetical protein
MVAVAMGDEDVGHVPALCRDPIAERTRLIGRHPRIGQHRVLAPVDQRAGHGREALRLSVWQDAVLGRRVVDEDLVGKAAIRGLRRAGCVDSAHDQPIPWPGGQGRFVSNIAQFRLTVEIRWPVIR